MSSMPFPAVKAYPLPIALKAPRISAAEDAPAPSAVEHASDEQPDDFAAAVSAQIARRARQRRYTG